jgi:hypothetical protein
MNYLRADLVLGLEIVGEVAQGRGRPLLQPYVCRVAAHRRDQRLNGPLSVCVCVCVRLRLQGHIYSRVFIYMHYLRADLAQVLEIMGEVAQGRGRRLLHTRALNVAAHRRDQGLDPPLYVCVCVCVCVRLRGHIYTHVLMCMHYLRAYLAPAVGSSGEAAQSHGRRLLHARALLMAAHRRDQDLDPPLCMCVCVCVRYCEGTYIRMCSCVSTTCA